MDGSATTITQLFAIEAAKGLPPTAGAIVIRVAYDAGEAPVSPSAELERFYVLCRRATLWSEAALRRVELNDYADFVAQGRGWGRDGFVAPEQTLRTAVSVLGGEPYVDRPDEAFVRAARKTTLETVHALEVAGLVADARAERSRLRAGVAAASRAFVAAQPFLGGVEEARAAVGEMREVAVVTAI